MRENWIEQGNKQVSETLQARVDGFYWHHSIDLGKGVVTRGGKSLSVCSSEARLIFDRVNLNGLSVLDVGAWNGFFSFEAKRRGAGRVMATDSFCWRHPHIRGREAFEIARSTLGLELEAREIDAGDLSVEDIGAFDAVLYLGVFYHRYDAIEVLAKVARLASQLLIVETHLDLRQSNVPAMAFYPGKELNNDPTNWWGPNEHCVIELLRGHGFIDIEVTAHPEGHNRAIFHAWRTTMARTEFVPEELKLKPIAEINRLDFQRRHPIQAAFRKLIGMGSANKLSDPPA